ncbi:hypothetical protein CSUI_006656 [Cystoisospora suis]|uniref:Uncharacterized protein n=1 Tax=Cystoisospora suis TaxID=483139 RepID=A0A2C6KTC7_9APIC|nr:hypothetical protein CSUI_006656 [Cystoisospora suis]
MRRVRCDKPEGAEEPQVDTSSSDTLALPIPPASTRLSVVEHYQPTEDYLRSRRVAGRELYRLVPRSVQIEAEAFPSVASPAQPSRNLVRYGVQAGSTLTSQTTTAAVGVS